MLSLWTYRFNFSLPDGEDCKLLFKTSLNTLRSVLYVEAIERAMDETKAGLSLDPEMLRQHVLEHKLRSGGELQVSVGYVTYFKAGIVARLDGDVIYESHPGRSIDKLSKMADKLIELETRDEQPEFSAEQKAKFKRNWPSLAVDIALGFVFFFVAKYTDLTTAALWGAGAGLGLVVVQQFVKKIDLLGGLAVFGIVMMIISATYALVLRDEELIQMRTTIMGGLGALLYLVDGAFGGRYLGERTARYMFMPDIVPQRLSIAFGGMSITMALLNWGVVKLVSKDIWLYYTTFGDFLIAMVLLMLALKWIVKPGYDAEHAPAEPENSA